MDTRQIRRLMRHALAGALWVYQPDIIQLDCFRGCNLKCAYCNVSPGKAYSLDPGMMPMAVFNRVLLEFNKNPFIHRAFPFMNGEPMLDPFLDWRVSEIRRKIGCRSHIVTNAAASSRRRMLINPDLDVRITISAATPETYETIMGRDLFHSAMRTAWWVARHRHPKQGLGFNFVRTPANARESEAWLDTFAGFHRSVFPTHQGEGREGSKACTTGGSIMDYDPYGCAKPRAWNYRPCNVWNNLSIGKNGEIMLCCDSHPKHNFGNILRDDWRVAWRERNRQGLDNGICSECSYRRPDAIEWQKRYYQSHGGDLNG